MTQLSTTLTYVFLISTFTLSSCNRNFSRLVREENRYELTISKELTDSTYRHEIENFYTSGEEGYFSGVDSVLIYYRIYEHPKADKAILISSGRTEAAIKYKELIFDLFANGYSIYIHDHRGQGQSGRMAADPDLGYIDDFQYYVDYMHYFYQHYLKSRGYDKTFLLAHSMGGAIGMTYLEQYPNDFTAAAFSSPMLGLKPGICGIVKVLASDKPKYAIGQAEYNDAKAKFKGNTLTGSEIRYDRMVEAYRSTPEARLGGASYQWLNASCEQFEYIFSNIDKIQTPFILFSAENEQIVYPFAHQKFVTEAQKLGKECMAYEVESAKHELLIEKDEQRIETINNTLDFFARY